MAKVTGPLFSSEARGRVGGLVYNTHRGVSVVKAKHAPCQPRTSLQLAVRAIAVSLVRGWAVCANKAAWNDYAALHPTVDGMGNSIRATGSNWYVALNTRLLRLAGPAVETAPAVPGPAAPTAFSAVTGAGLISVTATTVTPADETVEYWLDGARSAGRIGSLPRARWFINVPGDNAPHALNGLAAGTYTVYARTLSTVDGQVSPWISADVLVT